MSTWEQSPNNKNIFSFGFTFEENDYIRHLDGHFRKNKEGNFNRICLIDRFGLRYDLKVDDKDKRFKGEDDEKYATRLFRKYVEKIPEEEELGIITVAQQEELEKNSKKKHDFKDIEDKENTIYSFLNNKKDPSNIVPYKPSDFFFYVGKGNIIGAKNLNKGRFYEDGTPAPRNYFGNKIFSLLNDNPDMIDKITGHDLKLYYKRHTKDNAYKLFYEKYGNTMINLMKRNMTFSIECNFDEKNRPTNFDIHYTDWFTNTDLVKSNCAINYNNFFNALTEISKIKYNIVKNEKNEAHSFNLEDLRKYLDDNKTSIDKDGQKNKNSMNSYYKEPIFNAILKKNNISYDPTTKKFEFINKTETKKIKGKEVKEPGKIGLKYLAEVSFEECAKELIQERVEDTFINYIKSKQKLPRDQFFIFLNKILGEENITKFLENNNIIVENKEVEEKINSDKIDKEDKILDTNSVQKDKNTASKDNSTEKQNTAKNKNVDDEEIPFDKDFDDEFDENFDQEDYTKKMLAKRLNIENEDLRDYDIAELQYMVNHPEEFEQEETEIKTEESDLMEKLHSLYIKNTSFTKGILLVPVGNNEQIEFTSYEDVKNYIEKNNISGKTVEELYHNFLLSVEEMRKKEETLPKPVEENAEMVEKPVSEVVTEDAAAKEKNIKDSNDKNINNKNDIDKNIKETENKKDIEKETVKIENKENTPSLMQQFFALYQKNTQATNGKLSISVGDKKRLEFDSYKDAKKYMHKRNISGNTAEEIFNNLVEDVKATYLKKVQQENKKEDVEDKTKESTTSEKSYADSKLYKVLSVIAHKLDDTIAIIDNFKNQILKGKQFDAKKVLSLIGANIKDAFNYTEIEGVEKQTTKDKEKDFIEALNDKVDGLTKIINNQNAMIQKQNEMMANQSDTIAKQNEIITALYSKISLDKLDEIKTEMDEIDEKYSQNNENVPAQDDKNSDRTDF